MTEVSLIETSEWSGFERRVVPGVTGNLSLRLGNAAGTETVLFNHSILKQIPEGPSSLEKDIFPKLLERGVYALDQQGMFIDIGTPDDYARAQTLAENLYQVASFKS